MITKKMRTKNLTLIFASILAIFLLTGLGSAAITLNKESDIPTNMSHGEEITIDLNVSYDGNQDNITLNWSGNPSDYWTLPSLDLLTNDSAEYPSAKFKIPENTGPGTVDTLLKVDDQGPNDPANITFSVNILEDKSLSVSDSDFNGKNTTTITITNEGNTKLSGSINTTSDWISLDEASFSNLAAGDTKDVTVKLNTSVENLNLGDNVATITVTSGNISASGEVTYYKPYLEDVENVDNALNAKDFELVLDKGFGDEDDNDFYPLDEVSAEFELENKGNKWDASEDVDVEDMEIEACLFDVDAGECIMDEEDMELSDNDFDLKDGDDKDITVSFKINPEELTEGNEDFRLFIKLVGDTDSGDDSYDELETGISIHKSLTINQDEFVIVDNFRTIDNKDSYECGSETQLKADIWNIGGKDIEKDEVYVGVYNERLGIEEVINLNDLDALESLPLELDLTIPEGLDEGTYNLDFVIYDDEDLEDNDIYELNNDDSNLAIYTLPFEIKGNCAMPQAEVSETFLDSGEYAGDVYTIKTKISNTGDELTNYTLTASEYSEWASSIEFSTQTFSLQPGESKDIKLQLQTREDISGNKTFNMEIYSGNELVTKQPVQVPVKETSKLFDLSGTSLVTVLAIAISIVLIAIIIVLVLRISQKEKTTSQ